MISFKKDIEPYIRKLEEIVGLSFKVFLFTSLIVMGLGIYVSNLLFGNYSMKVLQNLKSETQHLKVEIETLKKENAKLHKKYLEWSDAK